MPCVDYKCDKCGRIQQRHHNAKKCINRNVGACDGNLIERNRERREGESMWIVEVYLNVKAGEQPVAFTWGPFADRSEAERCCVAFAGRGDAVQANVLPAEYGLKNETRDLKAWKEILKNTGGDG